MFDSLLLGNLKICHLFSALQLFKNASAGRKGGGDSLWDAPAGGISESSTGRVAGGLQPSLPISSLPGWKGMAFQQKIPEFPTYVWKNNR